MAKFKRWWWLPQLVGPNLECTRCGSTRLGYMCHECGNTVCMCCPCPLCNRMDYKKAADAIVWAMTNRIGFEVVRC